ncbi:MAG: Gfo/Idh/MocA family oxidoreductase [Planctomycetes bacterium]|nr:Gfo/Idh/MocA family oxidoreductase [Planctomycetota bacterium]
MSGSANSRREFLTQSAKLATAAGLATATVAEAMSPARPWGSKLKVTAGPRPRSIGPNDVIRFGLIGVGGQGRHDLPRLLKFNPRLSVKTIADPDPENVKQALQIVKEVTGETPEVYPGFDDWKDKLLARDDVDAILTATPCYMHGPIYLGCFAAGKHFYGEKPLCIEANEADALVEAQRKNPEVQAQIGFQRRGTKLYPEGIKRIRDGVVGDLIEGRGAWNNSWGPLGMANEVAKTWPGRVWFGRRKYSGDWMLEQACHTWDVFCWVTGKAPVAAMGLGRPDVYKDLDPLRDVTDFYFANIEFAGGFMVDFQHSWICPKKDPHNKFNGVFERVAGRKGGILLNEGIVLPREDKGEIETYKPDDGDHYVASLKAFVNSIRTHAPVVSSVETARLATYTGLLVRKAVDERRRVEIKELGYKVM